MLLEDGEVRRRRNKRELVDAKFKCCKKLLEDEGEKTRPRGCKYPTPPCALAKIKDFELIYLKKPLSPSFKSSQEFDYPLLLKECAFKSSQKQRNIASLSATLRHCKLLAEGVQWLTQSDYSICISILVDF